MKKLFETAHFTRGACLKIMASLTEEQLLRVPEGHKNSIFWNVAHLMVTQQLLTYKLSGLDVRIDPYWLSNYAKGTVPPENVTEKEIDFVKAELVPMSLRLEEDYNAGIFEGYQPYMTSANIELTNIDEALAFSAYHDGIHLGILMSLRKIV